MNSHNFFCSIRCCYSEEFEVQNQISEKIDKQLQAEAKIKTRKLLLLGPGESGKSTFLKQMQIIHTDGFSPAMMEGRRYFAYSNIKQNIIAIIHAMPDLGISVNDDFITNSIDLLERHFNDGKEFEPLSMEVVQVIKKLWKHPKIQETYNRRAEFQLYDNAHYLFQNIDRIADPSYIPSTEDVLIIRVPTVGVNTIEFNLDGAKFSVFDAGGQRAQRRKWIRYFDNVDALIFIAAISEYNQVIREDNQTNRLIEAFDLFQSVANQEYFSKAGIILFLNKKDLFAEKINQYPLEKLFPAYKGGANYNEAVKFIRERFEKLYKNKSPLYTFETCATDTNQIRQISFSVFDAVFTKNMKRGGF